MTADEFLTIKEVATLLKLAEKTVYSMAQQHELPVFKIRGQWRFKREDLDRWIEERKALLAPATAGSGRKRGLPRVGRR